MNRRVPIRRRQKNDVVARDRVRSNVLHLKRWVPKLLIALPVIYILFKLFDFATFYRNVEVTDVITGKSAPIIDIEREKEIQRLAIIVEDDSKETHISFVAYFAFNRESGRGIVLYLPGWVYLRPQSTSLEKEYKVADLLYLSKNVRPSDPYGMALSELEFNMAMEIDDYIWFKPQSFKYMQEITDDGLIVEGDAKNLELLLDSFSRVNLFFNASSAEGLFIHTLSSYSFVNIWSESNKFNALLDSGAVTLLELDSNWGVVEEPLPIGKMIKIYDYRQIDSTLSQYREILKVKSVQREQVKIEVYNGAGYPGLASMYARRFANAGIEVIRADNAQEYERTRLYIGSAEKYGNSLEVIKGIVAKGMDSDPGEIEVVQGRPDFLTTGDIVVVLGKDAASDL